MPFIQNPKVLKEQVKQLHQAHGAALADGPVLEDSNIENLNR